MAREDREIMGRLRNCIVALAEHKVLLYDTSIQYTYDASLKYEVHKIVCMIHLSNVHSPWEGHIIETLQIVE